MKAHSDKRSALLRAALELFAENGFTGSSTALIAKRAGVASGTLFFYFTSKEQLIHELFREVRAKIDNEVLEEFPAEAPVRERFLTNFSKLLRYFLENPQEFKFIEQYHFSPFNEGECCSANDNKCLSNLLVEAREQGLFKNAPLQVLKALAFGPIASLAKEHVSRALPIDDEMIRVTIAACWDGLKR